MRTTTRDALRAMHSGLVGEEWPAHKVISAGATGNVRIIMTDASFKTFEDGDVEVDAYLCTRHDPNPRRQNAGYGDAVVEQLEWDDLAASVWPAHLSRSAWLLTPKGLEIATALFGPPAEDLYIVDGSCVRKA